MVKPYPAEVREHAITLRKQGLQYKEIRQRLREEFKVNIAEMTLKRWFYRVGLTKKCRSLKERLELAEVVKKLYEEGLGCSRIQKRLIELGYGVSYTWIDHIIQGIRTPDRNLKKIRTSGYEFGYVIGALLSDGYIYQPSYQYICRLTTKDIEFRDKFIDCAEKIRLHASYFYKKERKTWIITIYSKTLHDLLKTGKWMELMGPEEEKGFLDGYYDGDGSGLMPDFTSTDVEILEYIRGLLEKRGIRTSQPILTVKAGKVNSGIKTKRDAYAVYIHPYDYDKFEETVKTCIQRKKKLIETSKRAVEYYDMRSREDWWKICEMLQKGIGKRMMRSRRKRKTPANPPPLNPFITSVRFSLR